MSANTPLDDLRQEIDAIDDAIQRLSNDTQLLMARPGYWRPF